MRFETAQPFVTTAVLVVLTVDLLRRHLAHKGAHKHLLLWAIGLTMFFLATLAEGLLELAWNEWVFRGWYLFGAVLSAAWIGQGTVYLLIRKPWVKWTTMILTAASAGVALWLAATPVNGSFFQLGIPISLQYAELLPRGTPVRLSTIPFNIYGTVALVGGALWSSYLFWRKRVLLNRVIGNILIAVGSLSVALGSTLARLGEGQFLAVGQLVFALLLYAGFILASRPAVQTTTAPARAGHARPG